MRTATFTLLVSLLTAGGAAAGVSAAVPGATTGDGIAVERATASADAGAAQVAGAPDEPDSPLATFSYYTVLGVQLQPRVSATSFAYGSNGCLYVTAGSDNRLLFPLLIPQGSEIKYLRVYYNDTNAGTDLTAWLTRYEPGQSSTDLISVTSSGSGGYGTSLSAELFEVFDSGVGYSLIAATNTTDATVQICGVRIAYYAP